MNAIVLNLIIIAVIVAGWTAAVWAFYNSLGEDRAQPRTARHYEVIAAPDAGSRPAARQEARQEARRAA